MTVFRQIFETLREYYENREPMLWWPEDPLEVIVGAVLVQGSTWKSVDRVLKTLRDENRLDFNRMLDYTDEELAALIRPVGFQSKKVGRLKALCQLFLDRSEGQIPQFFARDPDEIRRDLMAIQGIGPGTADNILLYAGKIPIYMVDPFTFEYSIRARPILELSAACRDKPSDCMPAQCEQRAGCHIARFEIDALLGKRWARERKQPLELLC